jgi:uncharacterized protein (UPF0333 family)
MGALLRTATLTIVGMVATYAIKKMMASVTMQAERVREQANAQQNTRDMKDAKRLKQDPATGVYYAED